MFLSGRITKDVDIWPWKPPGNLSPSLITWGKTVRKPPGNRPQKRGFPQTETIHVIPNDRTSSEQHIKEKKVRCGVTMMKSVETRFVSRHVATERGIHHKKVYKVLTKDELFLTWPHKTQETHTCDYSVYFLIYRISYTCDYSVYLLIYHISLSDEEDGVPHSVTESESESESEKDSD